MRRSLIPGDSVKGRAISSGIWEGFSNVFGRSLQLVKLVVLANLLSPKAFGIFTIALLTKSSLRWFSLPGIDESLIQKSENNVDEYLNTAFSIKIGRGIFLAGLTFLLAPAVANFFNEPTATDVIRVVAIAPLLGGLRNPSYMYFRKDLEFNKKVALQFLSETTNVFVAIAYALIFATVWAFVAGRLAGRIINIIGSYLIHSYRPWPEFDTPLAREMISYGKWITASGPLLFLLGQGDDVFAGWFLGTSTLGLYRVAYRIGNAPGGEITEVVKNIAFPTYSKLQGDQSKLRMGYLRTIQLTMAIIFPATVGIALVARPFVEIFMGQEWISAVPVLQILVIYSAIQAFGKINNSLLKAVGRPDINTKFQFLRLMIVAVLIFPLAELAGLLGVAAAVTIGVGATKLPHLYFSLQRAGASVKDFLSVNSPPMFASAVMGGCVFVVSHWTTAFDSRVQLISSILVGGIAYVATILLIEQYSDYELTGLLRRMVVEVI